MAELHTWEQTNLPFINSSSGRALYFSVIEHFLLEDVVEALPLKSFQAHLSDRATRMRIRDFEQLGLLVVEDSESDHRSKTISPTPKLWDLFNQHNMAMGGVFGKRFNYFGKNL